MSDPVGLHCPGCGEPAKFALSEQAFCGNPDCHVFMWHPGKTLEENAAHASWIELPDLGPGDPQ